VSKYMYKKYPALIIRAYGSPVPEEKLWFVNYIITYYKYR